MSLTRFIVFVLLLPLAACMPEFGDVGAGREKPIEAATVELPAPARRPAATQGLDSVLLEIGRAHV